MTRSHITRLAAILLAAPLFGACSGMLDNQTLGTPGDPTGGPEFRSYAAIGTSIGAGIQSGGLNDSTQREAYTHLLARAMGYTPGLDWNYPSMAFPGCPPPFTNPLTNARIGGGSATTCARRAGSSVRPYVNNAAIPFLRAGQVLDIQVLDFPLTDSLKQMQFLTGALAPIEHVERAMPTFVTIEIGANDVLHAATRGDALLLTPIASFQASLTAIADRVDAILVNGSGPRVAIAGVPNVTRIPHMTAAGTLFCLKTGACPGVPATPPFSLATFTIDASCAPAAPGIGLQYLLPFTTTATVVAVLSAGGAANINCATDVATVTTAAGTGPAGATVNATEYAAINTRVGEVNTAITTLAAARGYAFVNFDSALAAPANAALIPPVPLFTTPTALFGPLFSLDGVHPTAAGQRIIATIFANAINNAFGTALVIP